MRDTFKEAALRFQHLFDQREANLNGQKTHPWHLLKREAMTNALALGFPDRKNENWKYTSVQRLLSTDFVMPKGKANAGSELQNHPLRGLDCVRLVFVNGQLDTDLSEHHKLERGIHLVDLKSLEHSDADLDLIKASFNSWAGQEDTSFLALNLALSESALLINVPDGIEPEIPLHFIHISTYDEKPVIANPLIFVRVGSQSRLRILESTISGTNRHLSSEYPHFSNTAIYLNLGPGAYTEHYKIQLNQQDNAMVHNTRVIQARDSHYRNYSVDLGGGLLRNNIYVRHLSSGITTDLYGIYIAGNKQHIDNQSFVDHAHPHCQSNELYKGIVAGHARAVFNGKIIVRQDAQKTNAFQQNSNLLLSDNAVIDSKPQLEIFADDVRCSHGGTIGQLDEQALYYLKTRGLTDADARGMLQHAFIREVIDLFEWDQLKDRIDDLIKGKFVQQRIDQTEVS